VSIIKQIVNKFPSDYAPRRHGGDPAWPGTLLPRLALASDKQDAFLERYNADEAFKKQMNSSYACKKQGWFDFWFDFLVVSSELREYLKPELKRAEVILIEGGEASALSLKQLERAVSEVRNVEELQRLVLGEQSTKMNIWIELERRLENNCETRA